MVPDFSQDYFSLFGLPRAYRIDAATLDRAYHALQGRVHPDRHAHLPETERRLSMQWATQVNEAYRTLKTPLLRKLLDRPAALCAGLFFAFYPTRYESMPHVHQLGTQYIPLAILFTERWLERARARDAALLAASIALQTLSSFYLAYALVLMLVAYVPAALWRWRRTLDLRRVVGLGLAGVAGLVPMGLTGLPYLELRSLGLIPTYKGGDGKGSLFLIPYFAGKLVGDYLSTKGIGVVGYAMGQWLAYAKGGGAWANIDVTTTIAPDPVTYNSSLFGAVGGAGFEVAFLTSTWSDRGYDAGQPMVAASHPPPADRVVRPNAISEVSKAYCVPAMPDVHRLDR